MTGSIGSLAPAGCSRQELAELTDRELLDIVNSLPRFSQRRTAACDLLVSRYRDLVWSCVPAGGPQPPRGSRRKAAFGNDGGLCSCHKGEGIS